MTKISSPSPSRHVASRFRVVGTLLVFFLAISSAWSAVPQHLHGHVPRAVSQLRSLRHLENTNVLQLAIGLPLRNQSDLTNLLQDLYNPASPNYRHFLSADEFASRFGPTEQDYQAVKKFAKTNGFRVVGTHPNRMILDVAAAVPDIERTFHLSLQVYPHPTEAREFYAPDAEPLLNLATPVLHISGLDNFLVPQPMCRAMNAAAPAPAQSPAPAAGSGPSGNYAGRDFRAAYAPGVTNTGAGQVVGLLEFQGYFASDIQNYETTYSLPNIPLNNVLLGGLASITTDAGDAECPLDIEMAISMATNLSQVIVYCTTRSGNTDDMLNRMATDNLAKQLSASWLIGADATGLQIFQQFAAQGQSYFNASGDSDAASAVAPITEDAPYITIVGGTTLVTSGAGGSRVSEATWNRGNGTGSTGGISPTYTIPPWQQGINMDINQGSSFMRNVPDVSMVAENIWVLYNNGGSGAFGGTSCATPLWAGFMALVNQQAASNGQPPIGFINPAIYAIGKSANFASDFHDITTGNNTQTTSPTRFSAFPGYDLCTGWGTPSGQNLINALLAGTGDTLMITPANGLGMAGPAGGSFAPTSGTFTLVNFAGTTNRWSLINTSAWFTAVPASGTLLAGASANVTVILNSAANSLPAGYYTSSLLFSNQTTSAVQTRPVSLVVGTGLIWDAGAAGGAPQDGPGIWADQSSVNGNTNWSTGAGDVLWNNSLPEIATFGANSGAADTVTMGSAVTAAGINFNPPGSGNYTIADGGNTLTLNGNIIANASATLTAPVVLGSPAVFSAASGQTLTVSGLLSSGGLSNSLAITGPGIVSLTGQNNTGTSAGMAGSVTVNSGTLSLNSSSSFGTLGNVSGITVGPTATLSLQGVNAISGSSGVARSITLNGGVITNAGVGNHALGVLTLNGGTLSGNGGGAASSFNLAGDVFVYSNSTISAQNVTTTSGIAVKVAGGQSLTVSGTLTGNAGLNCNGSGTVILVTNNTYSGGTTINAGTLTLLNPGGLGANGAGVTVGSGGQLQISTNLTTSRPLTLNGVGPVNNGALRISSGANVVFTGGTTLGSAAFINLDNNTTLAINNSINGSSSLNLAGGNGSQGVITGSIAIGAGSINKSGAGTWIFSGFNSFSGALNLDTGSTTANDGIVRITSGASVLGLSSVQILNNNLGFSTLQLSNATGSIKFTAPFFVSCRSTAAPMIENMNATNTIAGTVWLNVGGNLFNIQSDAGELIFSGTNQYVGSLTGGRTYAINGAGDVLVSGPILNSTNGAPISLSKTGTGTLTLAATNTYANGTTVSGGTLLVNGSILGALTLTASVTLGGNGAISSAVTVPNNAVLAPGTNFTANGTLTVSNSVTLQSGSTTVMKISKTPLVNNALRIAGSHTLTYGGSLIVTNLAGAPTAGDSFKLFNAPAYTGSFTSANLPPLGTGLAWNTSGLTNGLISVVATTPPQFSSITENADGNFQFSGAGAAGVTYTLNAATNLIPPVVWNVVASAVAAQNGQFQLVDLNATNFPQQFYRITSPF